MGALCTERPPASAHIPFLRLSKGLPATADVRDGQNVPGWSGGWRKAEGGFCSSGSGEDLWSGPSLSGLPAFLSLLPLRRTDTGLPRETDSSVSHRIPELPRLIRELSKGIATSH
jgi:hypothetical protein